MYFLFSNQQVDESTKKRLSVLTCQLRKAEESLKTYEVATDKLLTFAEVI